MIGSARGPAHLASLGTTETSAKGLIQPRRAPAIAAEERAEQERYPMAGGWPTTIWRTLKSFVSHDMTDWASALTYYGLLSLFPALIALVSLVGLFGNSRAITRDLTDILTALGPHTAAATFRAPIQSLTAHREAAGVLLVTSTLIALWSASGYVAAFARAANSAYEMPEGRPIWKLRPLLLLITFIIVLGLAATSVAIALTGPVVRLIARPLGISGTAVTVWNLAKWPVLLVLAIAMLNLLSYATPNVRLPGFRWITPGSLLTLVVWLLASVAFAFYVANFGAYDKTYGTLGGVVVLLVWLWLTNAALLLGVELNAERQRNQRAAAHLRESDRTVSLPMEGHTTPQRAEPVA